MNEINMLNMPHDKSKVEDEAVPDRHQFPSQDLGRLFVTSGERANG